MLIEPRIFLQKKPLNFISRNHFRDEITIDLCIPHFAVESASKFSLHILWKMVLLEVHDFQNGDWFRTLQNVSINFLLFYHNNVVMLKTDIMLDYW